MKLRALRDNILCTDGDFGDTVTSSGLIIKSTIGKGEGITPRWFKVFEIGPEIDWVKPGQWVYVAYGRWTEAMELTDERFDTESGKKKVWKVEAEACLALSDEKPHSLNIATDAVTAFKKTRD